MPLIAMASYCTPDNNRFPLLLRTLDSLARTVDWSRHRLVVIDNGSTCPDARGFFGHSERFGLGGWVDGGRFYNAPPATLIRNAENRGQARALNQGWVLRNPGEHVARIDSDVAIPDAGWLDRLCDCLDRDPTLGLVALKRTDAWERPDHPDAAWRSELRMLPHEPGQDWLAVEAAESIMGTCQAVSHRLVDRVGYLYQGKFLWSLEDTDFIARAAAAGFWGGFFVNCRVTHLDQTPSGGSEYQRWKEGEADAHHPILNARRAAYLDGSVSIYRGPDDE